MTKIAIPLLFLIGCADTDEPLQAVEQAVLTAPAGTRYEYTHPNGNQFRWTNARRPGTDVVAFLNERVDGTWSKQGTVNRWSPCPHANEQITVSTYGEPAKICTHVCLPNGSEELHCPNAQLLLRNPENITATVVAPPQRVLLSKTPDPYCLAKHEYNARCLPDTAACLQYCRERFNPSNPSRDTIATYFCAVQLDCAITNPSTSPIGDLDLSCGDNPCLFTGTDPGGYGGEPTLTGLCRLMGYVGLCPLRAWWPIP